MDSKKLWIVKNVNESVEKHVINWPKSRLAI